MGDAVIDHYAVIFVIVCLNSKPVLDKMSYACGDCYPQYNVQTFAPASLKKKLLGKDIDIEFTSKKQEQRFNTKAGDFGICNQYNLTGDLYYSFRKGCYVMKLSKYIVKLREDCVSQGYPCPKCNSLLKND